MFTIRCTLRRNVCGSTQLTFIKLANFIQTKSFCSKQNLIKIWLCPKVVAVTQIGEFVIAFVANLPGRNFHCRNGNNELLQNREQLF